MTEHLSPDVIRQLQKLWVALPVKAPNDGVNDPGERQRAILEAYCEALSDCTAEAIGQTVKLLIAGKIDAASKSFCPKPPELASFVRAEQESIRAERARANRAALPAPEPEPEFSEEHRGKMRFWLDTLARSMRGDPEAKRLIEGKGWRS